MFNFHTNLRSPVSIHQIVYPKVHKYYIEVVNILHLSSLHQAKECQYENQYVSLLIEFQQVMYCL